MQTEPQGRTNDLSQPIGAAVPGWTARPHPTPGVITGRWCRLEPLHLGHADALYEALTLDQSGRQWTYLSYGPFANSVAFTQFVAATIDDPGYVTLAIVENATGRAVGFASYLRIKPAIGSIEVGGITFGASLQRTPAATEAMYLMATYAFEVLGYRRYEWKCDALNAPSRAAALRLGFSFEGIWRNATLYKGRNRDTAWFAMTDADWTSLRPAILRWLDPSNFDDAGRQRTALSDATAKVRRALDA